MTEAHVVQQESTVLTWDCTSCEAEAGEDQDEQRKRHNDKKNMAEPNPDCEGH